MDFLKHLTFKLHILPNNTDLTYFNFNLSQETLTRIYFTFVRFSVLNLSKDIIERFAYDMEIALDCYSLEKMKQKSIER